MKPPQTIKPTRSEPACHAATPTTETPTIVAAASRTQSMRVAGPDSCRNSNDGRTRRTRNSGTSAKSTATSTPMRTPCPTAAPVRP